MNKQIILYKKYRYSNLDRVIKNLKKTEHERNIDRLARMRFFGDDFFKWNSRIDRCFSIIRFYESFYSEDSDGKRRESRYRSG